MKSFKLFKEEFSKGDYVIVVEKPTSIDSTINAFVNGFTNEKSALNFKKSIEELGAKRANIEETTIEPEDDEYIPGEKLVVYFSFDKKVKKKEVIKLAEKALKKKVIVYESISDDEEFISEAKLSSEEWNQLMVDWTKSITEFLKGKKLGSMEIENIRSEFDGIVEFNFSYQELQLKFMVKNDTGYNGNPNIYIGISSPNKRGVFETKVTGRNGSNEGVWKKIEDIYNGKYKR